MKVLISVFLILIGVFILCYSFVTFETMNSDLPKSKKIVKYILNTILFLCAGMIIMTAYEIMLGVWYIFICHLGGMEDTKDFNFTL